MEEAWSWFNGASNLTALDYAVVIVAIAMLFVIGFAVGDKETTTGDFFLA
ncbi:MAG: hypothetical protein JO102_07780, partial [Elusimicrobia bacterium]|nr:hypothetical protein [Elusimicrobiota bacterium]